MSEPLLDLTDTAVWRMLKTVKRRGYVTRDELNEVPPEEFSPEQIEGVVGQLTDMGIRVVASGEDAEDTRILELPQPANRNSPPKGDN